MLTHNHLFEAKLREEIESQIATLSENIASGLAADHADYRWQAGRIAGLRLALDCCDNVHTDLAKT